MNGTQIWKNMREITFVNQLFTWVFGELPDIEFIKHFKMII